MRPAKFKKQRYDLPSIWPLKLPRADRELLFYFDYCNFPWLSFTSCKVSCPVSFSEQQRQTFFGAHVRSEISNHFTHALFRLISSTLCVLLSLNLEDLLES